MSVRVRISSGALALALCSLVSSIGACRRSSPDPAASDSYKAAAPNSAPASTDVRWVSVEAPGAAALTEFPAVVKPDPRSSAVLAAPYACRVLAVYARAGDTVKAGQKLLSVRMPDLVTAAGELIAARTRLQAYARRKDQLEALKAEGLARLEDISNVEVNLAESRATEQRALGLLEGAGVGPSEAQQLVHNQGRLILRSPMDGTVVEMNAALGAQHEPGATAMARIVGTAPGRIEARMAHAMPSDVELIFRASTGATCPVARLAVSPSVDENDGSQLSWFTPNCNPTPTPGTRGVLLARFSDDTDVTRVPARGIARTVRGDFVFKKVGETAVPVLVETVVISGSDALIRGSLRVGDTVAAQVPADWNGPEETGASGATNAGNAAPTRDTL